MHTTTVCHILDDINEYEFPGGSVVKNPPASSGDVDLIPGLGRSLGEGNDNIRQNYVSEIPRTEEPGGLQSMGS